MILATYAAIPNPNKIAYEIHKFFFLRLVKPLIAIYNAANAEIVWVVAETKLGQEKAG